MTLETVLTALRSEFGKPGLSTKRAIGADEVREAFAAIPQAKKRIRIYSNQGFVPNSYRNRCQIQYVQADLIDGDWQWTTGWTGAQRSRASGNRVVVQ
jgi:hypothetical protein